MYQRFLQDIRYSSDEFWTEESNELASGLMVGALTAGTRAPASFGKMALAFQSEKRVISVAQVPMAMIPQPRPPTNAPIQDFYRESAAMLRTPEYRALTLVMARPADFAAQIQIPDDQLHARFEQERPRLTQPEKRSFVQLSAPSQAVAEQAAAQLAHGQTPEA